VGYRHYRGTESGRGGGSVKGRVDGDLMPTNTMVQKYLRKTNERNVSKGSHVSFVFDAPLPNPGIFQSLLHLLLRATAPSLSADKSFLRGVRKYDTSSVGLGSGDVGPGLGDDYDRTRYREHPPL